MTTFVRHLPRQGSGDIFSLEAILPQIALWHSASGTSDFSEDRYKQCAALAIRSAFDVGCWVVATSTASGVRSPRRRIKR